MKKLTLPLAARLEGGKAAAQTRKKWPVKLKMLMTLVVAGAMLLAMGCQSLFPSKSSTVESRWQNYAAVESAFAKIIPYRTDTNGLKALGFYPSASPNIKILNYPEIVQIFLPNAGIEREDLPAAVRECIDAREQSCAYLIELRNVSSRRHGNLFLDMLAFKRRTHEEGWEFTGLMLVKNGVVVYKLASGEPHIARDEKRINPLGPLQEVDGAVLRLVSLAK